MNDKETEAGKPTVWDNAWREGHAHGLMTALGIPYKEAYQRTLRMLTGEHTDPAKRTWLGRLFGR